MPRRALSWLSALPLLVLGTLAAHGLAYRIVEPDGRERADLLGASGHGYLDQLAFVAGAAAAVVAVVLAGHAVRALRRRPAPRAPSWQLVLLPLASFPLQEHLERLLGPGTPSGLLAEPAFLVGLALQVPLALAALVLARILTGAAETLGRALARPAVPRRPRSAGLGAVPVGPQLALLPALARGFAGRGPP